MAVTWTPLNDSFVPTNTGWNDYDIYTIKGVPKGATVVIVCANSTAGANRTMGVRTDESSINRYVTSHEAEGGGQTHVGMSVTVHATTGLIEIYTNTVATTTFYILGYWTGVTYIETAPTSVQPAEDGVWGDRDIQSLTGNSKTVEMYIGNWTYAAANLMGVRTKGSSLGRYVSVHEDETAAGGRSGHTVYVKTDSSGVIQQYAADESNTSFYVLGYFDALDYQELYVENTAFQSGSDNTWTHWDVTTHLDQDGRVCDLLLTHEDGNAETNCGARINGSEEARYLDVHEAETNGQAGFSCITQSYTDGNVQVYCEDASESHFYLMGYFKFASGVDYFVTCEEILALKDVVASKGDFKKTTAEKLAMVDGESSVGTFYTVVAEKLALLDGHDYQKLMFKTVDEKLAMLDVVANKGDYKISVSEIVSLLDDHGLQASYHIAVIDKLGMVDDVSKFINSFVVVSENLAMLDTTTQQVVFHVTVAEKLAMLDSDSRQLALKKIIAEKLAMVDTTATVGTYHITVTESLAFLESVSKAKNVFVVVSEKLGLIDDVSKKADLKQLVEETLAMNDSSTNKKDAFVAVSELLGLVDDVSSVASLFITVDEILALKDDVTKHADYKQAVEEVLSMLDNMSSLATYHVSVNEKLGMVEVVSIATGEAFYLPFTIKVKRGE